MSYIFTSLAAVVATGAGNSVSSNGLTNDITLVTTVTGAPTNVVVALQGSLDGVNWFNVGPTTTNTANGSVATAAYPGANPSVAFLRANLTTLTGGTSPTVTSVLAVGAVR